MAESTTTNPPQTSNPPSDTEGGEKPVREQLKKTSIDVATKATEKEHGAPRAPSEHSEPSEAADPSPAKDVTKLRRKRSRDDDEYPEDVEESAGRHIRKRSRDDDNSESPDEGFPSPTDDSTSEPKINGSIRERSNTPPNSSHEESAVQDAIISPTGKRTRAQFQTEDENPNSLTKASKHSSEHPEKDDASKAKDSNEVGEPGAKRPREIIDKVEAETEVEDEKASRGEAELKDTQLAPSSGFANASNVSPFASLGGTSAFGQVTTATAKTTATDTKDSKASSSPFGSLGQSAASTSPFAALSGQPGSRADTDKKIASVFGGALSTQSGFGAVASKPGASGFGGLTAASSSPFASALNGKSAFGGFAATTGTGSKPSILGLSGKPARPFGAPQSEEGKEGSDDEADATDVSRDIEQGIGSPTNDTKRDKRFVEQEVETGEENEKTLFSSRGKLYYFDSKTKSWVERGTGLFKCNITRADSSTRDSEDDSLETSTAGRKARFILRAEGSQRLLLNSPLSKQTKFGDANGQCPKGSTALWYGVLDGHDKPLGLQVRLRTDLIPTLWEIVNDVKEQLS